MILSPLIRTVFNKPRKSLKLIIEDLSLSEGLKLCLDAGDIFSAPPGATSWLDRTANGYDFFLGTTSGADATDPTFNGVVGNLSANEYWSFDGGDFFRYDTTNETWMQNIHKDNAKFSVAGWVKFGTIGTLIGICGTHGAAAGNTGFSFFKNATNQITIQVLNAGTGVLVEAHSASTPEDIWKFVAASVDEPGNVRFIALNNDIQTAAATYVLPSAVDASFTMEIGARGNANSPLSATSNIGLLAIWEGVALSDGQLNALYQATRGRYGI